MQNTVDILPSNRSSWQELTICIARFLVDLQIFSIASETQKSSYPLAIHCRFVDFSTQKSTYPYAKHCRYSSLSQNCQQELTICIARFLVDLQIFSIAFGTQKSSYPLAIPCRFVDFSIQKFTYPYAKHCRHSSLSQKLLVGGNLYVQRDSLQICRFSKQNLKQKSSYPLSIPCRFADFYYNLKNPPIHMQITVAFLTSNRRVTGS